MDEDHPSCDQDETKRQEEEQEYVFERAINNL
jgi:hypothetical protein